MQDIYQPPTIEKFGIITNPDHDPQGIRYTICRSPHIQALENSLQDQIRLSGIRFDAAILCLRGGAFGKKDAHDLGIALTDTITTVRYQGTRATRIKITQEPTINLHGLDTIVFEDVIDKGPSAQQLSAV